MPERFIHSIQEHVERDGPQTEAAPALPRGSRTTLGRDNPAIDPVEDTMTEEALLCGLERLTPEDLSTTQRAHEHL
jgi:hypothetical protein